MTEPGSCTTVVLANAESAPSDDSGAPRRPRCPPELLLEIMRCMQTAWKHGNWRDSPSWRATLGRMLRVSRTCYALGLPVLLRDLEFSGYRFGAPPSFIAFLEDGLGMDKFRFVRKLKLRIAGAPEVYNLFKKLLRKVRGELEQLVISVDGFPPPHFFRPCGSMSRLKKLRIEASPISEYPEPPATTFANGSPWRAWDECVVPYFNLLKRAEKLKQLEEFELYNQIDGASRRYDDLEPWPEALCLFPKLRAKLSFVALTDWEVPEWADFPPPNVKECLLDNTFDGLEPWKAMDAFPGLERLEVLSADTCELVDWPLRSLKHLSLSLGFLNLDPKDFAAVRKRIEEHNVKVTIDLDNGGEPISPEEAPKWRTEFEFWTTVRGAEVKGFKDIIFGYPEEVWGNNGGPEE